MNLKDELEQIKKDADKKEEEQRISAKKEKDAWVSKRRESSLSNFDLCFSKMLDKIKSAAATTYSTSFSFDERDDEFYILNELKTKFESEGISAEIGTKIVMIRHADDDPGMDVLFHDLNLSWR